MHAEAMLFVHNRQAEPPKGDALLHQRVRADDQRRALADGFQRRLPGVAGDFAAQPGRPHAERFEPLAEAAQVLLREQFRGRHDRGLEAVADSTRRRHGGNDRLAGTHVALHQPLHRVGPGQVGPDFADHALLRPRQPEGQAPQQFPLEVRGLSHDRRGVLALAPVQLLHAEVVREQFLERQALLGRVAALDQRGHVGARRRAVYEVQRVGQRRQAQVAAQVLWQQFLQFEASLAQQAQRLVGQ